MKKIAKNIKRLIISFVTFYLIIVSTSSSFARPYDAAAGQFVAEQYEAFINKYTDVSYYETCVPAKFSGSNFLVCCTTGPLYAYQNFLGINLLDYDYQTMARDNLVSLANSQYWEQVSFSEAQPGDIVVLDRGPSTPGHVEMIGENLGNGALTFLNSGSYPGPNTLNVRPNKTSWDFQACFRLKSNVEVTPTGTLPATTNTEREDNIEEDPEDKFYYQGKPSGGFAGTRGLTLDWLFNLLSQLVDFLAGLLTLVIRMVFVGYANILVNIVTNAVNDLTGEVVETTNTTTNTGGTTSDATSADRLLDNNSNYTPTSTELQPEGDDQLTIDKIILGQVPLLDVNFFSDTAGGAKLKDDGALAILRENIAVWYYALRNLSIVIMLLILIYLGIRLAISTVATEKAEYKRLLVNWLVGFIIIFFIHFYLMFILQLNETLIGWIYNTSQSTTTTATESSVYETVRTKAYEVKLSSGMAGTILYLVLVVLMLKFFYIYLKRLLSIAILTIMAPAMGAVYAFGKITSGKSNAFTTWMKDYTLLVLVQSVHALVYFMFVKVVLQLTETSFVGIVIALLVLNFMLKAANIFFDIFGMLAGNGKHSTLKSIMGSDARGEILDKLFIGSALLGGAKSIIGGTYRAGKGLIFGTSLTTKNAKRKAQAKAFGLNNISFKNIDAMTGQLLPGAKAKKSLSSKVFRRKDGKQLSNDLADRMKDVYLGRARKTGGVLGDSFKIPLRGAMNGLKIATAITLAVAGSGSFALNNVVSAVGSMSATHYKRKNIRGARKANAKAEKQAKKQAKNAKRSMPKKVAYTAAKVAFAGPILAGKLVTAPVKAVAGTVQDAITAEQKDIDYVQKTAPTQLKRIKDARQLEERIIDKYNQKLQETIQDVKAENDASAPSARRNDKFAEAVGKSKFNKEVTDSISSIFRVSDKVDKYMKDNDKSAAEASDVTSMLDNMEDYMKQNIRDNDATLSDVDIQAKINKIRADVQAKYDKQKDDEGNLHKDRLKNILEDTLEANDANEKVSDFMQDMVQDMRALQRTDRNYNIHFGGEDNYMYKHSETGKSNLKNVLNSLTYLER